MQWQAYTIAVLFGFLGLACVLATPIGLPGTWLLLGLAAAIEVLDDFVLTGAERVTFGWELLVGCAVLGLAGEIVEAAVGIAGTRLGGGTRWGMLGAILGGIAGAILFTALLPLPFVGTLLGALVGTFAGAWLGEASAPIRRAQRVNLRAALAATLGRLLGTLGKTMLATVVWLLLLQAAFRS